MAAAVVAVALNQRPAVVAVAPLLEELRADTGLSSALAGLLTTLPVLAFGAFAPVAPRLAKRIGLEAAVTASLLLLAAGMALRLLPPVALLYAGSLLAGAAIALANVLLPAFIKRETTRPGVVLGLYTAALNVGAALGAAATVPLAVALDLEWRTALAAWLLLALGALVLWLPAAAGTGRRRREVDTVADGRSWALLRQPLARQATMFLGMQSVAFFGIAPWLPSLLADAGVPVEEGGLLLGLSSVAGAVGSLVAPAQAGRMRNQRALVVLLAAGHLVGLAGLLLAPASGTLVWMCLFGGCQGAGFAVALTLIVLRSPTPLTAARLGGVAQCLGYITASAAPPVVGALHDVTGGWSWPLGLMIVLLVPMTWAGWGAARDAVLDVPDRPRAAPAA